MSDIRATTLISSAMRKVGKIPEEQAVPGYLITRGLELLNDVIAEWGSSRIHIPYQSELEFELTNLQETYTVGPSPSYDFEEDQIIEVLEMNLKLSSQDNNTVYYPIVPMTEQQYAMIGFRAAQGTPIQYLLRNHVDYSEIRLQPVPSYSAGPMSILLICKQRLQTVTENEMLSQIPAHYILALKLQVTLYAQDILGMPLQPEFVSRITKQIDNLLTSNFDIDLTTQIDEIVGTNSYDSYYFYGFRF